MFTSFIRSCCVEICSECNCNGLQLNRNHSLRLALSIWTCVVTARTQKHTERQRHKANSIGATRVIQGNLDSRRAIHQKERARQHARHGHQEQSRVYSSTILLSQPSYKIDLCVASVTCGPGPCTRPQTPTKFSPIPAHDNDATHWYLRSLCAWKTQQKYVI